MNHKLTDMTDARLAELTAVADPGPKPDDRPAEQARRHHALTGVRAALDVEVEVTADAAAATASRAETAAWLGASLADLAAVTGHSRQAARKRWPALGPIARRRRWLGHHVEELLWAADLVLANAPALPATLTEGLADQVAAVRAELEGDTGGDPTARWRMLDDLVDRRLRAVAAAGDPGDEQAEFARHGTAGVVAYYDHATRRDDSDE